MSRRYPPVGEAEWSFISKPDVMHKIFCLTAVEGMLGENVIALFEQLGQLLCPHLASIALVNVNVSEPDLLYSLLEICRLGMIMLRFFRLTGTLENLKVLHG